MPIVKSRAVVITGPGEVALQEVALRPLGPRDALIQTVYTSISAGTERMLLGGQMPHPMLQLPVVPGYETVGQVIETGDDVPDEWLGRWVYVGGAMCYDGINGAWGGQSQYLFTDVDRLIPLGDLDPRHGVLLALTATSLHGVDVLDPAPESRVLVIGQGPVGQLAARIAMQRGAWVAVTDKNPARLSCAVADKIINVDETSLDDVLDAPVQSIIEASGSMSALTAALPHLDNGGTILLLGYYQNLDMPYMPLFLKEARLLTAKEWGPDDLPRSRDMLADGALDGAPLLTHTLPITDITTAYDIALNDLDCLKLVLEWNATSHTTEEATS